MKVIWHPRAENAMQRIADYISDTFGMQYMKNFMQEVRENVQLIKRNPDIAHLEPLFEDRQIPYRSILVKGKSKMVYYVKGDVKHIAGFWDCRQEPINQANQVE